MIIYIYIYRERERDIDRCLYAMGICLLSEGGMIQFDTLIELIYIYIYRERER